ncbi:uncharacterized protein ACNLHF_008693 [Anomaloglossus baeobatrachus]|uniref:uncharacterized protein LOC142281093 n=1 Tax=Anomaloglossus baeobatrachus TaxID=238106 RepID=UPI003F50B579
MLHAPAAALSTLLCVLLLPDLALASSARVLTFFAGESVTFSCSDETNRIRNVSQITVIVWRKENGSHPLHYISDGGKNVSNFTDPRISFLSTEIPPMLRIRDVRPEDAGNYTCEITAVVTPSGIIRTSWTLHITEQQVNLIYILCSVAGAIVILIIIGGILYWRFCTSCNSVPSQIHQTCTEDNEKEEEPVYDNIPEDYFLRFNTLYDRTPVVSMSRRPDNP